VSIYDLGHSIYASSSAPHAIREGIRAVMPIPDSSGDVPLTPTNDCGLTLPVYLLEPKRLAAPGCIRREIYQPDKTGDCWEKVPFMSLS